MKKSILITLLILLTVLVLALSSSKVQQKQKSSESQKGQIKYVYFFFDEDCFRTYFSSGILNASRHCYSIIFSRLFSIIIFVGSFFTRIPQIATNIKNRSVEGLSYFGNNFETIITALTASFGLYTAMPFSVYGENYFLFIQGYIILILFFIYGKQKSSSLLLPFLATNLICLAFMLQLLPNFIMNKSMYLQIICFLLARGSQLLTNHQNKSTGTLSVVSMSITVGGNLARTFSTLVQANGQWLFLIGNSLIPLAVNLYIMFQFYIYRNNKLESSKKAE